MYRRIYDVCMTCTSTRPGQCCRVHLSDLIILLVFASVFQLVKTQTHRGEQRLIHISTHFFIAMASNPIHTESTTRNCKRKREDDEVEIESKELKKDIKDTTNDSFQFPEMQIMCKLCGETPCVRR